LFGWRRDEMLGQPAARVLLPPHGCGQRARHRGGREFDVELSQWLVPHSQPPAYAALVRDITQRKEAEEARSCELRQALQQIVEQEKMVALGSIVAGVAHELNTPVGNLVLLASTLRDRVGELADNALAGKLTRSCLLQAAGECREASDVLIRSADKARELIESFKNVAVDQASQRRRRFDLHTCLHDILVTLGRMMRQANVAVELQVPPGVLMDSYPGHLEQVLNNLIVNSILHGFEGRSCGKVSIVASVCGEDIVLVYSDDGVGIAPELQEKIFEPFFSTKVGAGGSGLGMYIVNNLVCGALQGSVSLSSTPGQGVRFEFRLPRTAG
jgi:signal transduction histidine kinase